MAVILAVDPGREKCGLALVDEKTGVIWQRVVPAAELMTTVGQFVQQGAVQTVVAGDRTGSAKFKTQWDQSGLSAKARLVFVDEHMSSVEGRRRYLRDHPGKGLRRLLPIGLKTPDQPFDDYVAVILAERFLKKNASLGME
ncbi:MAG TPA: resolvase [Firmicutes bacterium]|jgi:RNase H-fold protein (predicted Holliday junction resolvase)|nr:resolvase [Bacillota bacterium]HAW71146.1 resolvase [Bacillota bacterium]HAZ21859.1 resolvase [Bacillota bacterium]HBE05152.1 resolvase [Bacillota bacterium]HBG44571.1 resolvase [Bacillota bacterium]